MQGLEVIVSYGGEHQITAVEYDEATAKVYGDYFDDVDYWIVEKLIEWHFDVFGLIKKGLAIDVNNL
jgi:hypothetical protein